MAETPIDLTEYPSTIRPVDEDEISPDLRAEIVRRVERLRAGEESTVSHVDFMKELGLDPHDVSDVLE